MAIDIGYKKPIILDLWNVTDCRGTGLSIISFVYEAWRANCSRPGWETMTGNFCPYRVMKYPFPWREQAWKILRYPSLEDGLCHWGRWDYNMRAFYRLAGLGTSCSENPRPVTSPKGISLVIDQPLRGGFPPVVDSTSIYIHHILIGSWGRSSLSHICPEHEEPARHYVRSANHAM